MTLTYQTLRLSVAEVSSTSLESSLLSSIPDLLTPKVVENLPPHFQNIHSMSDAQDWYVKMVSESRLFVVKHTEKNSVIGFVFVFVGQGDDAHVGYLLGESYWGKGYATELLKGLVDFIDSEKKIKRLIAGVASNNIVSSKLLQKLGFVQNASESDGTVFYEYLFHKIHHT